MLKLTTRKSDQARLAPTGGDGAPAGLPSGRVPEEPSAEMSFLDHLEELRWRIIKALAAIVAASTACLFFADWVIDTLLLGPTYADFFMYRTFGLDAVEVVLQNRTVTGQFFAYFGTVLAVGLILGSPFVIYQAWRFVEPGLYKHEKQGLRFTAAFATFFFVLGITFGYLVITPIALQFFAQFTVSEQIINEFDITRYFSLVLTWTFGAGLLFELPVVIYFLALLGIVTPERLRTGRRYAVVIILTVAAFLTPPDVFSQTLMAIPLFGLYEISIWIAGRVQRRQQREEAKRQQEEAERQAQRELPPLPS